MAGSSDSSSSVSGDFRGGQKPHSDEALILESVPARPSTTAHFALSVGYVVSDEGVDLGVTRNLGHSTELIWGRRKVIVDHLSLLRAFVAQAAPEDLEEFDSMMKEMRDAST